ncbi:MAG TPA: hypothetical protein VFM96_00440 [Gaiellaceae bacterium]|nr:hypothetical protein [Gaiellaceae bacterium]
MDLSRLGVLVTRLRLDPPDDLVAAVQRLDSWVDAGTAPESVRGPEELHRWLGEMNARLLTGYLRRLRPMRDEREQRFATIALSGSLRPASRWLPGSIKPQIEPDRAPQDIGKTLKRIARRLAADCALEAIDTETSADVYLGTALNLPLENESADAVVTSPPYYVTYDYLDVQRLTYLAFGWDLPAHDQIGRRYFISPDGFGFVPPSSMKAWYERYRKEETVLGRALRAYLNDLDAHLGEVQRVLAPHGIVAYAIGNSKRREETFDLAAALAELMVRRGFNDVEVVTRGQGTRRILPSGRDLKTGRFSSQTTSVVDERIVWARAPKGEKPTANQHF